MPVLYNISIDIPTGEVRKADWLSDQTDLIPLPSTTTKDINVSYDGKAGRIDVESFISYQHAEGVAIEARERILAMIKQYLQED